MAMKAHHLTVTLYVPPEVSNTEVKKYVTDALRLHGSVFDARDPLFPANWDAGRIRVKHQK